MGDDDDFSVNVSDQTASEPASVPASDPAPQLSSLDDTSGATPPSGGDSSGGDTSSASGSSSGGDSDDFSVSTSDGTAHVDIQPAADPPETTMSAGEGTTGDDRPEEQHTEPEDPNEKIEEDSSQEAPEPPSGE